MPENKPTKRAAKLNSTQQFVEIKELKDGIVRLKNGGLRKVVLIDGLNFNLKSEEEQNLIVSSYQNLLNSIDFSLQIIVHTRKLNVDGYLNDLQERQAQETDEVMQNQIGEYTDFVGSLIESNSVMVKNFFAIIPYEPLAIVSLPKRKKKKEAVTEQNNYEISALDAPVNRLSSRRH